MTLTTEQLRERAVAMRQEALRWEDMGYSGHTKRLRNDADAMEELAANREAQPVALVDRRPAASGSICWQNGGKDLPHGTELYTAPPAPAPAVPAAITAANAPEVFDIAAEVERLGLRGTYGTYAAGWNACRAAMLAQPVSSGYKLVPVDLTDRMIDAFNETPPGTLSIEDLWRALLAAAPEGGN
ncbi:hypothetical protein HLB02_22200 [Serratia nevei]|nr:hypothetical protein [Serratia nevei]